MARARSWRDVRAEAVKSGHITPEGVAAARTRHEEEVRAYQLRQIREAQARRQEDVAAAMSVTQSRVSRIERGDLGHTELGTIKAYVEALGGRLHVSAEFDDEEITIA